MTLDSAAQTNKQARVLWWLVQFFGIELAMDGENWTWNIANQRIEWYFLSFGCARGQSWNNNTCFFSCEQFARWPACVANKQLGGAGRQKKICLETYGNHSPVYCNLRFFFWLPHVASLFFLLHDLRKFTKFWIDIISSNSFFVQLLVGKEMVFVERNNGHIKTRCHKTWRIIWIWINHSINLYIYNPTINKLKTNY
jgi:hypothetical protein